MQANCFLLILHFIFSVVAADVLPTDIISVPNMESLMETHAEKLMGKKSRWRKKRRPLQDVFYIQDSDSYLAPTDLQQRWLRGSQQSVSNFARDLRARDASRKSHFLLYTQFYFRDLQDGLSDKLHAVSLCHSEVYGEGSTVGMQVVFTGLLGVSGGVNVDPKIKWAALTFSAGLSFETAVSTAMSIKCNIRKGEMGQLFLSRTRSLSYTPWSRTLVFDTNKRRFKDLDLPYEQWPRESRVVENGIGEWVCATSSKADLQCHGVPGLQTLRIW